MPIRRIVVVFFALAGFCSGACLQSNLTTGTQSSGAVYVLYQPEASCWNGSLVMFAHGYVVPGSPVAVPQDQLTIGGISLPAVFNQLGYAFAASSFSKNGLAIVQGVNDTRDLVQNILDPLLKPKRVYLIGASEGGLVTALSAEQLPDVYNSAGAACGPIGSFQGQINYFGDFRVIFDYFFPRVIDGDAITIPSEVVTDWYTVYVPKITAALAAHPQATAQLLNVTKASVTSDPATVAETVLGVLWYNVFGTGDAVATLGGQPFDNHNRIYFGSSNDFLLNLRVERYTGSPAALAAVAGMYETSGKLKIPIVTLHTTGDPIIPYWQETLYTAKTLVTGNLFQRINLPVFTYGHCNFSAADVLGAFALIVLRDSGLDLNSQIQSVLSESNRAAQ
jgi:pimeloyl-ACP methyl ester carboxylesterase